MRALKLVQHMKANAGRMSEAMIQKIRASDRCHDLLAKVPVEEHKEYAWDIYSDLTAWLATETRVEHREAICRPWNATSRAKCSV